MVRNRARFLPRAIEEERRNQKMRRWANIMFLFALLSFFVVLLLWDHLEMHGMLLFWQFVAVQPTGFFLTLGILWHGMYAKNSVMELTEQEKQEL